MRQPGYYWLRSNDKWSVGEWRNNSTWWIIGHDGWFEDSDFDEIDENRIDRQNMPNSTIKGEDLIRIIKKDR